MTMTNSNKIVVLYALSNNDLTSFSFRLFLCSEQNIAWGVANILKDRQLNKAKYLWDIMNCTRTAPELHPVGQF